MGEPRKLAAKLVDASETGLGVETFVALPVGSVVQIEGDLRHSGYSLEVKGQAKVMHCQELGEGTFRIGLVFEEVRYQRPTVVASSA